MPRPPSVPTPLKRPATRPRVDASGPQVRKSVKLAPAEIEHLTRRYRTVNAGLRALTRADMAATPGK